MTDRARVSSPRIPRTLDDAFALLAELRRDLDDLVAGEERRADRVKRDLGDATSAAVRAFEAQARALREDLEKRIAPLEGMRAQLDELLQHSRASAEERHARKAREVDREVERADADAKWRRWRQTIKVATPVILALAGLVGGALGSHVHLGGATTAEVGKE